MDSKYPVGTPQEVMDACEEFYEEAEGLMSNPAFSSDHVRGFFLATLRLKRLLEYRADLAAAELESQRKAAIAKEQERQHGEPS